MKKFNYKYWIIPVILFVGMIILFRNGVLYSKDIKIETDNVGVSVRVIEAQYVNAVPQLKLSGSIEGKTAATISAKLAGRIEQVLVKQGQLVQAGQVLAKLESVELANAVRTAEQAVAKAQIAYELEVNDYERYKTLYAQHAIAKQSLDSYDAKLRTAQAELASAIASQSSAEQQYEYGNITAPVDGVVANVTATVGQVVASGTSLMSVQDISEVYAIVNIEQKDLGKVTIGQKAEVTVDTYENKVFPGILDTINPEAGSANRMFSTKIKIDNAGGLLKTGMFIKTQLSTGAAVQVLTVPQSAVIQKQGLYYTFTAETNKAVRHQIEIGDVIGDTIQIKTGLEPGAKVITSNVNKLKNGDLIRIEE
ncbi:MAG: efflux transporter, family, subunit [Firmicutes bacterium]|nr:efflux transporter, family, subunit [Bacillota bacterium]